MKNAFRDIITFFKNHWIHIIIAIPAAIAFTVLHELAHCAAVWIQGGTVTEFVWLPSKAEWGHIRYLFPADTTYNATAISLSPYIFWVSLMLLSGILACRKSAWPFWIASIIF